MYLTCISIRVCTCTPDMVQVMMPIHTRMIFRHFISFFWTSYVSFSRGALDDDAKDDAAMEEQERALGLSVTPR